MAHDTTGPEPTTLNNHHLDTLTAIYSHPTSGNIRWADVESLLGAVGNITEKHDGKFRITMQVVYVEDRADIAQAEAGDRRDLGFGAPGQRQGGDDRGCGEPTCLDGHR